MGEVDWSPHSCSFCQRIIIDPSQARPSGDVGTIWWFVTSVLFSREDSIRAETDGCPLFQQLGRDANFFLTPGLDGMRSLVIDVAVESWRARNDTSHATISWRWEDEDLAPGDGYPLDDYYIYSPSGRQTEPSSHSDFKTAGAILMGNNRWVE